MLGCWDLDRVFALIIKEAAAEKKLQEAVRAEEEEVRLVRVYICLCG